MELKGKKLFDRLISTSLFTDVPVLAKENTKGRDNL